jgi:cytoskeletal protein CcmA (bactofilin family)
MFGKTKEENGKTKEDNDRVPPPVQQFQRFAAMHTEEQTSNDQVSSINRGMTVVGKVFGKGTLHISGRIEGELQALSVLIDEGAQVEGDIVAEQLTIGGEVKGTIHANRVKLNSTAVVEGDIFHRSLAIEENARFEGSSRRQENAVEASPTVSKSPPDRADLPPNVASIAGNGKSNGAPDDRPAVRVS